MRKITLSFLILFIWLFPVSAEKFGSSLSTDYTRQNQQQDIKTMPIAVETLPSATTQATVSTPQQQTIIDTSALNTPAAAPIAIQQQPTVSSPMEQQEVVTPAIRQQEIPVSTPKMPSQEISTPAATLPTQTVSPFKKLKITVPDYEENYKKMMEAQIEAKRKKKKTLFESIFDEIMRYGLFIVLGFVVLIVIYALRKDKETPGTGLHLPQHPQQHDKLPTENKKDIWSEEF